MKTTLRRTASPTLTRRQRRSCTRLLPCVCHVTTCLTLYDRRAGLAGAFVDREFETRGVSDAVLFIITILTADVLQLDLIDRERAKHEAHKRLHEQVAQDY